MINFCRPFSRPHLNRMLSRGLVVGALATVSLLSGLAPESSERSSTLVFSSAAYAQQDVNNSEVSNPEVTNYAAAVLAMEPVRQTAYNEIKKIIGKDPPSIVCYQPESLNVLTGDARKIAMDYCNRSKEIVESNHLSIDRFNTITMNLQSNSNLKTRIHDELLRLQNPSPAP